jgi:hypothetical protein
MALPNITTACTYYVRVHGPVGATGTYALMVAASGTGVPSLEISQAGTNLELSWPADSYGFRLQSSQDLKAWVDQPAQTRLVPADETIRQIVTGQPASRFFRLVGP